MLKDTPGEGELRTGGEKSKAVSRARSTKSGDSLADNFRLQLNMVIKVRLTSWSARRARGPGADSKIFAQLYSINDQPCVKISDELTKVRRRFFSLISYFYSPLKPSGRTLGTRRPSRSSNSGSASRSTAPRANGVQLSEALRSARTYRCNYFQTRGFDVYIFIQILCLMLLAANWANRACGLPVPKRSPPATISRSLLYVRGVSQGMEEGERGDYSRRLRVGQVGADQSLRFENRVELETVELDVEVSEHLLVE